MQFPGLPYPPLPVTGPLPAEPRRPRAQQHELSQIEPSETALAAWQAQHRQAMGSTLAALQAPHSLQSNGTVQLINAYPHGLVYVPNRHISNGQQVLGKLYTLWFDASHRPYRFGGSLPRRFSAGTTRDVAARWQERFAQRGADATERAQLRGEVQQMADFIRSSLNALKNRLYPTADLFLHELHDLILQQFIDSSAEPLTAADAHEASMAIYENVLGDCYQELMRSNTSDPGDNRELWPVTNMEHKQVRLDQAIGLYVDDRARTGNPFATHLLDHAPWYPNVPKKEAPAGLTRTIVRQLRVKTEPVSHEAVRLAFRGLVLGLLFWDERLQRSEAVAADEVVAKPRDWQAGYAAYNAWVRARALAALAQPIVVRDPQLQAQLDAQRAAQAAAIEATAAFPVFANAPWRVQAVEVEQQRAEHLAVFKAMPQAGAKPMEGNCNSGVFFLLRQAALEQQRLEGTDTPPLLDGGRGWRTYGASTAINLPHPSLPTLPEAPQSA